MNSNRNKTNFCLAYRTTPRNLYRMESLRNEDCAKPENNSRLTSKFILNLKQI